MAWAAARNYISISIDMSTNTRELPVRAKAARVKVWGKAICPGKVKAWAKATCQGKAKAWDKVVRVKVWDKVKVKVAFPEKAKAWDNKVICLEKVKAVKVEETAA